MHGNYNIIMYIMLLFFSRNPVASERPEFRQLVICLSGTTDDLLVTPHREGLGTNSFAGVLGSPLEAGKQMYTDLQIHYLEYSNTDYELV